MTEERSVIQTTINAGKDQEVSGWSSKTSGESKKSYSSMKKSTQSHSKEVKKPKDAFMPNVI